MPPSRSRAWLDHILAGEPVTEQDVKKLVAECQEDLHLDYKAGALLQAKKAADTLREYVAAFANSDGGILLIGYDQGGKTFDGASAPGGGALDEWATRCLYRLTPQFSPVPRLRSLHVDGQAVLIVATPRSPVLIQLQGPAGPLCYIRIGDSNFEAPPYLVTDLVLGRRNHPVLRPRFIVPIEPQGPWDSHLPNIGTIELDLKATIENHSLVFAEDVRCGLVSWATPRRPVNPADRQGVPASLKAYLDVQQPEASLRGPQQPPWQLLHLRRRWQIASSHGQDPAYHVSPLEESASRPFDTLGLPVFDDLLHAALPAAPEASPDYEDTRRRRIHARGAIEVKAALYVLSRDAEPWWFQVTLRYDQHSTGQKHVDYDITLLDASLPVVGCHFHCPDGEAI